MPSSIIGKFPTYRNDRIRNIRLKLIIHTRRAEYNGNIKGHTHYDTIHEWGVVEELSAKLSNEILLLQNELESHNDKKTNSWDNDIMEKYYD